MSPTIEDRVSGMEAQLSDIHEGLGMLQQAVNNLSTQTNLMALARESSSEPTDDGKQPMRDQLWGCENCAARLGVYDKKTSELRIKHKEHMVYVTKGTVSTPCRRCGLMNTLQYEPEPDAK